MPRSVRWSALLLILCAAPGMTARAQFDPGFGPWGWGGWGMWGTQSLPGSIAQGMGVFAQGMGEFNRNTAIANAIDAETVKQWNEYLYQSQMISSRKQQERMARRQEGVVRTREEINRRLRDEPTPSDIARGDALNVALDEINNPSVYLRAMKGAERKVEGTLIRDIPFQYARAAITTSMVQLTGGGPPDSLKTATFAADREALQKLRDELRAQNEEKEEFDPATIQQVQTILKGMLAKVDATIPRNTPARRDAERYIKGLYGLTKMLDSPAINVLLAGVEKRPDTSLGELLTFMKVFNLRFGATQTPRQREVYITLYPLLDQLRDEVASQTTPDNASGDPGGLFSGMDLKNIDEKKVPAPTNPRP
jgi:hypothetical protein